MTDPRGPRLRILIGYRIFFALLTFAAVVTEIATLHERGDLVAVNLFSYFTIEANLFATGVFLLSAVASDHGRGIAFLRGASTLYMAITGIVFSVLLSGIEGAEFTAVPWDNAVLHYVMPVAVVADWLLDRPQPKITFRTASSWLVVPVVYAAYSLVRGPVVHWYPYPFLDPDEHGYSGIAITVVALLALGMLLTWLIANCTGRQGHQPAQNAVTGPGSGPPEHRNPQGAFASWQSAGLPTGEVDDGDAVP